MTALFKQKCAHIDLDVATTCDLDVATTCDLDVATTCDLDVATTCDLDVATTCDLEMDDYYDHVQPVMDEGTCMYMTAIYVYTSIGLESITTATIQPMPRQQTLNYVSVLSQMWYRER